MVSGARHPLRSLGGKLVRLLVPGVRQVHDQVPASGKAWEAANVAARKEEGPLWVVLGYSTAQGIGAPSYGQGYVGQLRAALDEHSSTHWRVLNLSKSGAR